MDIRIGFSVIFTILIAVLIFCSFKGFKSHKTIGKAVGLLDLALIPPMIGNLIIIGSSIKEVSVIGCYIYFIGMDLVVLALVNFTSIYCKGIGNGQQKPTIVYAAISADIIQLLLNPFFGHAFDVEAVDLQGNPYYRILPYFGQTVHRVVDYAVFFCVILIFGIAVVRTAKIYRERYSVILISLIIIGLWQTFYIFSRAPVDRSMIGYGVFGILVFYLSIYYRPLRLLDRMLSDIAANMSEAIFVFDQMGKCIWANETGLNLIELNGDELDDVTEALERKLGKRSYTTLDWNEKLIIGSGSDAAYYTIENHSVNDDSKHLAGSFLIIKDNTEEQKRMKREYYNSTHDSLTGLLTKQHLYECVRNVLNNDKETEYVALFVDVKNFKIVNDIFSTAFGDKALQQLADWIRNRVDNIDESQNKLYGRLVGDTFGIFITKKQFESDIDNIQKDLVNFIVSDGNVRHRLLIHIGVYEIIDRDTDVSVMFDRAHLALSAITGNYKNHIAYYDKNLREKVLWEQKITTGLTEAIETMQIRPYLQPITDRTGKVIGAEALARWMHPEKGFMSPAMFIPVLERNSMITEVDKHIWRCACKILSGWKGKHDDMFISVNISPKDFYFIDIVSEITGLVKEHDINPQKLRIEITETVMMTDEKEKFKTLEVLRKAGFIVEMDDFGSGYSSLNMLKDMPVDVLKIDMKFLANSDNKSKSQTIIRNIIKLSEELCMESLTEGVETQQQYSELSKMGCKMFQGYYFAKPLPQKEFEEYAFSGSVRQ